MPVINKVRLKLRWIFCWVCTLGFGEMDICHRFIKWHFINFWLELNLVLMHSCTAAKPLKSGSYQYNANQLTKPNQFKLMNISLTLSRCLYSACSIDMQRVCFDSVVVDVTIKTYQYKPIQFVMKKVLAIFEHLMRFAHVHPLIGRWFRMQIAYYEKRKVINTQSCLAVTVRLLCKL